MLAKSRYLGSLALRSMLLRKRSAACRAETWRQAAIHFAVLLFGGSSELLLG
jgi:hypothetical protein